ncbi:MAG: phosphotransferase [Emcibacter sp.]|nr:phosphotransferase [Emcibacter sp.]
MEGQTGENYNLMSDRLNLSIEFLERHGWGGAARRPLADDASFRRYERLTRGDARAVLMDAPPLFEDVRPFITIARYLLDNGLAAPKVMASDVDNGFLLLEDMGDALFARVIADDAAQEKSLYQLATQGLIHLHKASPPEDIPHFDMRILLEELAFFVDWYVPALNGKPVPDKNREEFLSLWQDILVPVTKTLTCLTLHDYHAENLMLKEGQSGLARLGLLDFQDALVGHPAYDLVSLLQDARRDVSSALEQEMLTLYQDETGVENFPRDYAILGAQRNTKIIGIFTRLCLRDGKANYLDKIPRVWALLERGLRHPALSPIKQWMDEHIPPDIRAQNFSPKNFMPQKTMILAAGMGKRMRPLSDNCPKPLITVAGKELLTYTLEGLCAAGVRDVVINTHYLADQMEYFIQHYYDHRLTFTLFHERERLLDSGGGVKNALGALGEAPFLVLNSDMIWQDGARQMLHRLQSFWHAKDMDILMLLVPRDKVSGCEVTGDFNRDNDGRLSARGQDTFADYVYGGIMIMKPHCFEEAPTDPFSLRQLFHNTEKQGRLFGVIHDGEWYHVGTPEERDKLGELLTRCQDD